MPGRLLGLTAAGVLGLAGLTAPAAGPSTLVCQDSATVFGVHGRTLAGPDGVVYSLAGDGSGELRRFRWTSAGWQGGYQVVGSGWGRYALPEHRNKVSVDERGGLYEVNAFGELRVFVWAGSWWTPETEGGEVLDVGWGEYDLITAAGDGLLHYFPVDAEGALAHLKQVDPDDFSTVREADPSTRRGYTGRPAASTRADGGIVVQVHSRVDAGVDSPTLASTGDWERPETRLAGRVLSDPVLVKDSNGRLRSFAVADGALWVRDQVAVDGPFLPWRNLGGEGLTDGIAAAVAGPDTAVVVRHGDGSLKATTVRVVSDIAAGSPAVLRTERGTTELVTPASNGRMVVTGQVTATGPYRDPRYLGESVGGADPFLTGIADGSWIAAWSGTEEDPFLYQGSFGAARRGAGGTAVHASGAMKNRSTTDYRVPFIFHCSAPGFRAPETPSRWTSAAEVRKYHPGAENGRVHRFRARPPGSPTSQALSDVTAGRGEIPREFHVK